MIQEAYVSFEVAKLLKEKGFEGNIHAYYHIWDNGNKVCSIQEFSYSEAPHLYIPTPTHQMACAWLREKYGIFIAINNDDLDFNWQCYDLINRDDALDPKILSESYGGYKTYENAVEAALKYVLKNLI